MPDDEETTDLAAELDQEPIPGLGDAPDPEPEDDDNDEGEQ